MASWKPQTKVNGRWRETENWAELRPNVAQQGTARVTITCENGNSTPAWIRTQMLAVVMVEVAGCNRKCMGKDAVLVAIWDILS